MTQLSGTTPTARDRVDRDHPSRTHAQPRAHVFLSLSDMHTNRLSLSLSLSAPFFPLHKTPNHLCSLPAHKKNSSAPSPPLKVCSSLLCFFLLPTTLTIPFTHAPPSIKKGPSVCPGSPPPYNPPLTTHNSFFAPHQTRLPLFLLAKKRLRAAVPSPLALRVTRGGGRRNFHACAFLKCLLFCCCCSCC